VRQLKNFFCGTNIRNSIEHRCVALLYVIFLRQLFPPDLMFVHPTNDVPESSETGTHTIGHEVKPGSNQKSAAGYDGKDAGK
jgi:hypothetical protein